MKEIMKALCGLWKEEWQGMVMGQLNYERRKRGRRGDSGALFQKERSTPSAFLWETIMGFTRPAARW